MSHHHEMLLLWMNQARYCICFTREQKFVFMFFREIDLYYYISLTAEDMASMRFWQQGNPMQSHGITIQI